MRLKIALVQYFQRYKESGVSESIISKARSASNNAYYIQAFKNKLSNGGVSDAIRITPYKQIAEVFFRWSQSIQRAEQNIINKSFYLSLANFADPTSSFLKFNLATILSDTGNYRLSKEILDNFSICNAGL